jgi:sigma-B regulation protein RsbU (phosphoserine phosphatase)
MDARSGPHCPLAASVPIVPEQGPEERLENLLALTEAGLDRLGVEELLVELLTRVREIIDADTAAVLLIDDGGHELVARAACGIEEEVRQGVRIPVGQGFAGTVAATGRPVALDRVGPDTVTNPILWEKGIRVMLGVPLRAAGRVIGVLHVGRLDHRPFREEDAELLGVVAHRVAGAVQSHQLAVERAAASLLERSLLPPTLPDCPGLEFAARYVTGEHRAVGGDWYDAFTLPSGMLWVVIGDVAGHGLAAAVVMGRVRSALRSYALEDHGVGSVLSLVDRKVSHFEVGSMVTVACAVSKPPYDRFEVVAAGHPPPVLAEAGQPARLVPIDVLPPLGAGPADECVPTTVLVPPGAVLLLYTDGLVERRGEDIDVGLDRLREAVKAGSPNGVCQTVMHDMLGLQGPEDDVAIIALRRTGEPLA